MGDMHVMISRFMVRKFNFVHVFSLRLHIEKNQEFSSKSELLIFLCTSPI